MKTIVNKDLGQNQQREFAKLLINKTGFNQPENLFFVQIDDWYAVDNTGSIFQMLSIKEKENESSVLVYESDNYIYNYAEDRADFEDESEDAEIYSHCSRQAELLYDERY